MAANWSFNWPPVKWHGSPDRCFSAFFGGFWHALRRGLDGWCTPELTPRHGHFLKNVEKNNFFQQVLGSGWRFFNEKNVGKSQSQVGSADAAQHGEDDPRNAISAVLDCPISTRKK